MSATRYDERPNEALGVWGKGPWDDVGDRNGGQPSGMMMGKDPKRRSAKSDDVKRTNRRSAGYDGRSKRSPFMMGGQTGGQPRV